MERESERAHGTRGLRSPAGKGRRLSGTAEWHQKRELRTMRAEDAASCIADRGIDPDPTQPYPKHRAEGSRFCDKRADYPNYFVTVQIWVTDRQQRDLPFDEEELMAHILAEYPKASYQQPKCYDFQKYAASFARTQSPSEQDVPLGKRYMESRRAQDKLCERC